MAKATGRKNKYYTHVVPKFKIILAWRRRGLTLKEIAKNLGVGFSNFKGYIPTHPDLSDILNVGAEEACAEIENAVFRTAVGYEYVEVKTILEGAADPKEIDVSPDEAAKQIASGRRRIERTIRQQPPNTTAQIFYLTNRHYDRWRHKNSFEHSGPDGQALGAVIPVIYLPEKRPIEMPKGANAT